MIKANDVKKSLEEIYSSVDRHLLGDPKPSEYLADLSLDPLFREFPFSMLYELKSAKQSPFFHPEGSVWNHTLMVVDEAAKNRHRSRDERALMWAALLHDIGKPLTTAEKNGMITAYDHDAVGAEMTRDFLNWFSEPQEFVGKVFYLVRYHMQALYVSKRKELMDIKGIRKNGDVKELALLCLCDRLGRLGARREREEEQINLLLRLCEKKEKV